MTTTNISLYRKGPEADTVDQVEDGGPQAVFPEFAKFNFTESGGYAIYSAVVVHYPGDSVRVKLTHSSGHEIDVCCVGDGEEVVIFPGSNSGDAGFPRLEVAHGDVYTKPRIVNIKDLILGVDQ